VTWVPGAALLAAAEKREKAEKDKNKLKFDEPGTTQQRIVFTGSFIRGTKPERNSFTVLAGEEAPTITGGFGQWAEVERPQVESLPVLTHFGTLTMTVPILFEAVMADSVDITNKTPNEAGKLLEEDISVLEWMGGRGELAEGANGVTPLVRVYSVNNAAKEHPLIPPGAQGVKWIVSGITFDANPLRNAGGFRIRQAVTVELKKYVLRPGDESPDGPAARLRAQKADKGNVIVHTKKGLDTVQQIASKVLEEPSAARKILQYNNKYNRKWKHGMNAEKHLKIGTEVWLPKSAVDGLGWPS
jgi:hypothetical protein